jgi:hypothetical protein
MNDGSTLTAFETILDDSGVAARLEALLALGVRPRQLSVRTLLLGILLTSHSLPSMKTNAGVSAWSSSGSADPTF